MNSSFDWKALNFFIKLLSMCLLIGVVVYYDFFYYSTRQVTSTPTPAQPALAVVESPSLVPVAKAADFSTTTSKRVINSLTIAEAVPAEGKFIAADLQRMKLYLYEDGAVVAEYPILTKGRPGTHWETPSGFYAIQTKERTHFSTIGHVYMPYSMQFYGNYFIHGWTYYPNGTPVSASFSGGCIKLKTDIAQKIFEFADVGIKVFVYDHEVVKTPLSINLSPPPPANIDAPAYLVADLDTGDVYAEKEAGVVRPIASVTKLMTALVANETINLNKIVSVEEGMLFNPPMASSTDVKTFLVNDLFYPLLMQSSDGVADSLASYYGTRRFIQWMNTTAVSHGMVSTTFADPNGTSVSNISSPEDLYRLALYISNKKSFIFTTLQIPSKTITSQDGSKYLIGNVNAPANTAPFIGGKVGQTTAAKETMVAVLSLTVGDHTHRVAVIVLGSSNQTQDTNTLVNWILTAATEPTPNAACASCTSPHYRKILP